MTTKYVLVSKQSGKHGRSVLVSFASKPMWKDYEELRRQMHTIPDCYDLETMKYANRKYGNKTHSEILKATDIKKELEKYKKDFPEWQ